MVNWNRQLRWCLWSLALTMALWVFSPMGVRAQWYCNDSCNTGPCVCVGYCTQVFEVHTDWNLGCYHCACTNGICIRRDGGEPDCFVCCTDSVAWCDEAQWMC